MNVTFSMLLTQKGNWISQNNISFNFETEKIPESIWNIFVAVEIGSCTSSTAYQTNYCERAYDGDDSTFWGANGINDQWIQLTFAQGPVTVGSFLFLNSENMNENCVRAELQFSDNTKQEVRVKMQGAL